MVDLNGNAAKLAVDGGFVFADGVKVCRLDVERGVLVFLDRDRRRAARRGERVVEVRLADLMRLAGG